MDALTADLRKRYPFVSAAWAQRLIRAYGTEAAAVLGGAKTLADLGPDFGATLTGAEVRWLMAHEFARSPDDVVWRRTKLGLRMSREQIAALGVFMEGVLVQDERHHGAISPAAE